MNVNLVNRYGMRQHNAYIERSLFQIMFTRGNISFCLEEKRNDAWMQGTFKKQQIFSEKLSNMFPVFLVMKKQNVVQYYEDERYIIFKIDLVSFVKWQSLQSVFVWENVRESPHINQVSQTYVAYTL